MRDINLKAEQDFENSKVLDHNVRGRQNKYYWATQLDTDLHVNSVCESISAKSVLEIGCSSGRDAELFSPFSSRYVGIDISDEAINIARAKNLGNCEFVCTDGHSIPFEDETFDAVIVTALLHHLDLEVAFKEITRVLKPKGVLHFREPLGTNPIFNFYRLLTPASRTIDERPFTFEDLKVFEKYFELKDVKWFGFLSIFCAFFPNPRLRLFIHKVDKIISKTLIKFLFWQFSGHAIKR